MDTSLPIEGNTAKRSSIYLKIRRRTLDQKAFIPTNLNIQRRATLHTRIEKPFDEAYNNSPRTRIAKMKASRKTPDSKNITGRQFTSESPTSEYFNSKRFAFDIKTSLRNNMLLKVSNLCEQERANTHKLLNKILHMQKNIEFNKSEINEPSEFNTVNDSKVISQEYKNKIIDRKMTLTSRRLKENITISLQSTPQIN